VYNTVVRLIAEPSEPVLKAYLIIATAYMRRNLFVNGGCLVEQLLSAPLSSQNPSVSMGSLPKSQLSGLRREDPSPKT
jgi:hypothetical protein